MSLYIQHSVTLDPDVLAGADVTFGTTDQTVRTNLEDRPSGPSGSQHARSIVIPSGQPDAEFSTLEVARALDTLGVTGLCCYSQTYTGVTIYQALLDSCGKYADGSVHRAFNFPASLVVPRRIRCEHQGDAVMECSILAFSETGASAPIVAASNVALPTISAQVFHTIGQITLGTVAVYDAISIDIDFGIPGRRVGSGSDIWPKYAVLGQVAPKITIRALENAVFAESGGVALAGKTLAHASGAIYLRKRLDRQAGFVANATAEHIKITVYGAAYISEVYRGSGDTQGEIEIVIPLAHDGTNEPLTIDTTSTIA